MKKILIFALCLFCTSCSLFEEEREIDSRLIPYVDSFYQEAEKRNIILDKQLKAEVKDLNIFGKSKRGKRNYIIIDESLFNNYSEYSFEIEIIVFHELGHSLLNKKHNDTFQGVMNTTVCINCFKDFNKRDQWIDELFFK